jgi:hypothetical protein
VCAEAISTVTMLNPLKNAICMVTLGIASAVEKHGLRNDINVCNKAFSKPSKRAGTA